MLVAFPAPWSSHKAVLQPSGLDTGGRNGDHGLGRIMKRLLPRVLLLLFLLGSAAMEGRRDTNRLDPYGAPLLDDLMQCPAHLNVSGASSLHRAQTSPMGRGKAGAGDPPAEEISYPWTLLSGVSAGEISRLSAEESTGKKGYIIRGLGVCGLLQSPPFISLLRGTPRLSSALSEERK